MDFDYITLERCIPNKEDHIDHPIVYRMLKKRTITTDDFLPPIYEPKPSKTMKAIIESDKCEKFSVSLYTEMKDLLKNLRSCEFTKHFAIGSTSIDFGISFKKDKDNHVDYFLYDVNTSPIELFNYHCEIDMKAYFERIRDDE